jgi:hypothetical protein
VVALPRVPSPLATPRMGGSLADRNGLAVAWWIRSFAALSIQWPSSLSSALKPESGAVAPSFAALRSN